MDEPTQIVAETPAQCRGRGWKQFVGVGALIIFFWVMLWDPPSYAAGGNNVDDSWILAYGHFLKHRLQAGHDYVFTYGPLGFLQLTAYDPALFWPKIAWEIVVKLLFACAFVETLLALPSAWLRAAACTVMALFAHWFVSCWSSLYVLVGLIHLLFLLDTRSRFPNASIVYRAALLALLSLMKFTLFSVIASGLALTLLYLAWTREFRRAALLGLAYAGFWVVGWLALGQRIENIPSYIAGSWEVAQGYTDAMSTTGRKTLLYYAYSILILVSIFFTGLLRTRPMSLRILIQTAIFGLVVFVQWKASFVRPDSGHMLIFFSFMLWAPFLLIAVFHTHHWRVPVRATVLAAVFGFSLIGTLNVFGGKMSIHQIATGATRHLRERLLPMLTPAALQRQLQEAQNARCEECALPRIRAHVQDAPIDVMSFAQGAVLLNRLNWQPRPVFQSYSAYTPALLERNARFFTGERAPEFVLFSLQSIDHRLPVLDDSLAILEVFNRYEPVLTERSFLLLKKRAHTATSEIMPAQRRTIRLNEEVTLEDMGTTPLLLALDIRHTLPGKARHALYKSDPLSIRLRTSTGDTQTFRLIPAMARAGFLLNPLLLHTSDVLESFAGIRGRQVTSFSIVADRNARRWYEADVDMHVQPVPAWSSPDFDVTQLARMAYPNFDPPPTDVESNWISQRDVMGDSVTVIHAESKVKLPVPPGARSLRARFGIHPDAYQKGETDGVEFVVEHVASDGTSRRLFEQYLDPVPKTADRGSKSLHVKLPDKPNAYLLLRTTNLPGHSGNWDWSYWSDVHVE